LKVPRPASDVPRDAPMLHRSFDPSGKTPVGLYDPKIAEPAPQPARGLFFCLCLALLQNKPVTGAALALRDTLAIGTFRL
jgi:hypothetical protein